MKNKILFVVDYTLDQYNSVRDILYSIIQNKQMVEYECVVVSAKGLLSKPIAIKNYEGYKTYTNTKQAFFKYLKYEEIGLLEKIKCICYRIGKVLAKRTGKERKYKKYDNCSFLKSIIKKEAPQMVAFLLFSPITRYADICIDKKIPYVWMLYDTYIERPEIDKEYAKEIESYVINKSAGYFVPNFFYNGYLENYSTSKIKKYNLPLLIDEYDVAHAYAQSTEDTGFCYFGQIQAFRNAEEIKKIFCEMELKLNIYSTEQKESDDVFVFHKAVTGKDLYNVVVGSRFLVAFDNNYPYDRYLPSKAYLYVSFTKPVIVFGNNESSAIKDFFSDYPYFYYHKIGEPTKGLYEFMLNVDANKFEKDVYLKYTPYSPENALIPLIDTIKEINEQ